MVLIRILVKEGLRGSFYVKKMVLISEKALLLTPLKTKRPFLAILWPNLAKYGF